MTGSTDKNIKKQLYVERQWIATGQKETPRTDETQWALTIASGYIAIELFIQIFQTMSFKRLPPQI